MVAVLLGRKDRRDHKGRRETLDPLGRKDYQELMGLLVLKGYRVFKDCRVPMGRRVSKDRQAHRACKDYKGCRGLTVPKACRAFLAPMVRPEHRAHKGCKASKAFKGQKVQQGLAVVFRLGLQQTERQRQALSEML